MRDAVYDVAVVGFGPSGAVPANLLGQAGLTTYVCDKASDVYEKPRAIALDHEIMRVFQQIGVADKDTAERIAAMGPIAEPGVSVEQTGAFLRSEMARWSAITREIGVLPE